MKWFWAKRLSPPKKLNTVSSGQERGGGNDLSGDRKPHQLMLPEGAQKGHIGGIAAAGNQHPAAARDVVPCIKYVPAVFKKHLKPGGEIHGRIGLKEPP